MSTQIGFLAWKGSMEDGFSLVWPQYGYVMRGRKESNRGYSGLIEDLQGYGPAYRGLNLRMGAFRTNGWCILVDTMLDKEPLEKAARRLSVNFKKATIAAMADTEAGHFYVGFWDGGRHLGHVDARVKLGEVDVDGSLINGDIDPSNWAEGDWEEALKGIGLDVVEWPVLDPEEAEFEIIEIRRDFVPDLPEDKPMAQPKAKPWWQFWG